MTFENIVARASSLPPFMTSKFLNSFRCLLICRSSNIDRRKFSWRSSSLRVNFLLASSTHGIGSGVGSKVLKEFSTEVILYYLNGVLPRTDFRIRQYLIVEIRENQKSIPTNGVILQIITRITCELNDGLIIRSYKPPKWRNTGVDL